MGGVGLINQPPKTIVHDVITDSKYDHERLLSHGISKIDSFSMACMRMLESEDDEITKLLVQRAKLDEQIRDIDNQIALRKLNIKVTKEISTNGDIIIG